MASAVRIRVPMSVKVVDERSACAAMVFQRMRVAPPAVAHSISYPSFGKIARICRNPRAADQGSSHAALSSANGPSLCRCDNCNRLKIVSHVAVQAGERRPGATRSSPGRVRRQRKTRSTKPRKRFLCPTPFCPNRADSSIHSIWGKARPMPWFRRANYSRSPTSCLVWTPRREFVWKASLRRRFLVGGTSRHPVSQLWFAYHRCETRGRRVWRRKDRPPEAARPVP